jgi:hypothetical protein
VDIAKYRKGDNLYDFPWEYPTLSDSYKMYRTIHNSLQKAWDFDPSKRQNNGLNILTGFICGIIQSKSVKLADIAGEIPGSGKEESQIM